MNQRLHDQVISSRVLSVLCAMCMMAAAALPVAAATPGEEEPGRQASETPTAEAVSAKAIRVIYDPETGEIISVPLREPGEILSAPLAKALTRTTEGLQVFELSNGGTGVHLDGRFQHALMVRVRPDGSVETVCTSHSHAAEKFLQAKPTGVDAEPRDK